MESRHFEPSAGNREKVRDKDVGVRFRSLSTCSKIYRLSANIAHLYRRNARANKAETFFSGLTLFSLGFFFVPEPEGSPSELQEL